MKKSLLFAAVAIATVFGASADTFTYDFYETPLFCKAIYAEQGSIVDEALELVGCGLASNGNWDFIDKTGTAINTDGTKFNVKGDDDEWHALTNLCISLVDGRTYILQETETSDEYGFELINKNHPFICWDQEGKGPARVLCMGGWGSLDEWKDDNYNAIDADNWVATKNAIAFNRNAETGSRTGTYVQFPEVVNPTKLTIYIGHAGGKFIDKGLYAEVVPVVNGVPGEVIAIEGPADAVAKRYYKMEVALPALEGNVAFRIGCGGSELGLYHVVMEGTALAAVDGIQAATVNSAAYNMLGVQVDENYKGLVIKNGKKFIQK